MKCLLLGLALMIPQMALARLSEESVRRYIVKSSDLKDKGLKTEILSDDGKLVGS